MWKIVESSGIKTFAISFLLLFVVIIIIVSVICADVCMFFFVRLFISFSLICSFWLAFGSVELSLVWHMGFHICLLFLFFPFFIRWLDVNRCVDAIPLYLSALPAIERKKNKSMWIFHSFFSSVQFGYISSSSSSLLFWIPFFLSYAFHSSLEWKKTTEKYISMPLGLTCKCLVYKLYSAGFCRHVLFFESIAKTDDKYHRPLYCEFEHAHSTHTFVYSFRVLLFANVGVWMRSACYLISKLFATFLSVLLNRGKKRTSKPLIRRIFHLFSVSSWLWLDMLIIILGHLEWVVTLSQFTIDPLKVSNLIWRSDVQRLL